MIPENPYFVGRDVTTSISSYGVFPQDGSTALEFSALAWIYVSDPRYGLTGASAVFLLSLHANIRTL